MEKRKNDEPRHPFGVITALKIGLAALILMTACGAFWLFYVPPAPYYPLYTYTSPTRVYPTPYLGPQATDTATSTRRTLPSAQTRFVLGMANGEILISDGGAPHDTGLHGDSPTLAPDGHTMAYVRDKRLFVYRDGGEDPVWVPGETGEIMMPAWSADGESLAFVAREMDADVIYRLNLAAMQPIRLLSVPEIAAPPLFNPATGRLLIAERASAGQTAFYTIDPNCGFTVACKASRKDIATVAQTVNWASYHPSATEIVFSDRDRGSLYLLNPANGDVTTLLSDGLYKRRPVFSRDGAWLAYVTDAGELYALHLDDMVTWLVSVDHVASADWAQ